MSNSMGVASVFVLSSLLLSPLAMAEESAAFVARNVELSAAHQQAREAYAGKPQDTANTAQQTASKAEAGDHADS
ncbi:hypothetical protein ACQKPE_19575 [Pseudomonas sp. NPDC089554]|uniref:hypothetical protein n=1 Tax=Pseudomonas sp. NPDC089554 TaxID=3390653 RepID=UPI003D08CA3B